MLILNRQVLSMNLLVFSLLKSRVRTLRGSQVLQFCHFPVGGDVTLKNWTSFSALTLVGLCCFSFQDIFFKSSMNTFFPKLKVRVEEQQNSSKIVLLPTIFTETSLYVTFLKVGIKVPKYEMHPASHQPHRVAVEKDGGWLCNFSVNFLFLKFISFGRMASGILVPRPGVEPTSPAPEVRSLNHWTTRDVPINIFQEKKGRGGGKRKRERNFTRSKMDSEESLS